MKRISVVLPNIEAPITGVLWTVPYELCQYGINAVIVWDVVDKKVTKTLIMNILGDHPIIIKDNNPVVTMEDLKRIEEKFNTHTIVYSAMMGIMPNMMDKEQGKQLIELLEKYREDAIKQLECFEDDDDEGSESDFRNPIYG